MLPVVGKDISFFRQFLVKINDMSWYINEKCIIGFFKYYKSITSVYYQKKIRILFFLGVLYIHEIEYISYKERKEIWLHYECYHLINLYRSLPSLYAMIKNTKGCVRFVVLHIITLHR
jgi:hypothetical protein